MKILSNIVFFCYTEIDQKTGEPIWFTYCLVFSKEKTLHVALVGLRVFN
jgi:uncharacterized RDD family membrane protein YckC